MSDEDLAYQIYEWLRLNDSGNGYAGHDGMTDATLDGTYDLVALAAHVKNLLVPVPPPRDR